MSESYRESHKGKGVDYDDSFRTEPYRAMLWRIEQRVLERLVPELLPNGVAEYLDFACGTGRVLAFLGRFASSTTGVDVSENMLDVARRNAPEADLRCGDLTAEPLLADRKFDLISAFRFFPNAEDKLRSDVMAALVRHLAPSGVLIFNNHTSASSMPRRIAGFLGRESHSPGYRLMARAEAEALVTRAGLRIVRQVPIASLPMTERHLLRPLAFFESIERALTRVPATLRIAQNIIYACRPA